MAQRVQYITDDDLDQQPIPEGEAQSVSLSLDGVDYELDLRDVNADRLRTLLAPFLAHATPVGGRKKPRKARRLNAVVPPTRRPSARIDPSDLPDEAKESAELSDAEVVTTTTATAINENRLIREWGQANGYEVKPRGRIAPELKADYYKAQKAQKPAGEVEGS